MNQSETGHQDKFVVVGEQFTYEPERCPADCVDFVARPELAPHRLHYPVADMAQASLAVGVVHLGKLLLDGASEPGLFADFTERAFECGLTSASSAFGQRPVLSVRSVDYEHLLVMLLRRAPHDSACRLDHSVDVRFVSARSCVSFGERRPSGR